MAHIRQGYRGLSFLIRLNADRMLFPAGILAALCAAHQLAPF